MNILLTCAGRRNYLVDYFKEALNSNGKVYVANSTPDATAMLAADGAFVAPPLYSEEYIGYLKGVCQKHDIKLLVSLFDLELPVLAKRKKEFEKSGVTMAVSDPEVIAVCNDKVKTVSFTKSLGLSTLFTTANLDEAKIGLKKGDVDFPLFIKPRWGMGSIAMQQAETMEELKVLYQKVQRDLKNSYLKHYPELEIDKAVIIQEAAKGTEYGLDVVNDLDGNYKTTFVKRKLAMRTGETDGAVTEDIGELKELGKKVGQQLGHVGNLDMDVFWNGEAPIILEMNARFGGGYPFSHLAGADLPKAYISWTEQRKVENKFLKIKYGVKAFKALYLISTERTNIKKITTSSI